jgi:transcriptional regulator with XRE-family HTH domain
MASAEQIRSARLIAELLDDVHQRPELFAHSGSTGKFLQHASNTLFDGELTKLAKHLGVQAGNISNWCSGTRPSLPHLANIANRCGCNISDVLLGNDVTLEKMPESANSRTKVKRRLRFGKFQSAENLIAELKRLDKLGKTKNLSQTCRLLDISDSSIRKLAPDYAAQLVIKGREARHQEKIEGEKARFDAYLQTFEQLCKENTRPTGKRVAARMFQRTGRKINAFEACRFHARAMRLAKLSNAKLR